MEVGTMGVREPKIVYQDGDRFYAQGEGEIYQASVKVADCDMDAATKARNEFIEWAKSQGIVFKWESEMDD